MTSKQTAFCKEFVISGNGTRSAQRAGYEGDEATLAVTASRLLKNAKIQSFLADLRFVAEKQTTGRILSATETLVGITRIATSDIADLFPNDPFLRVAKEQGVSRLIKTINFDKDTGKITKLEMYSAQTAFQDMGRYHKLFPTKIEISTTEVDQTIEDAIKAHKLPETFGGEAMVDSEM